MTEPSRAPPAALEFWFEFASLYSYPSVMRIEAAARRHDVRILWKPFLLGPIFRDLGMTAPPFVAQQEKGTYVWQDIARQCRKYGLRWTKPGVFPRRSVLPLRLALLGADQRWMGAFCRRVMELNFVEDQDIEDAAHLARILDGLGLPAAALLAEAQTEPVKARLREATATARAKGIFGAPTFFVGNEMFWGDDRLDDALLLAAETGSYSFSEASFSVPP